MRSGRFQDRGIMHPKHPFHGRNDLERMNRMEINELWERTCQLLQMELNEVSYNTWIKSNLSPHTWEGDRVTLSASAEYLKTFVESRYTTLINNCLSSVAGRTLTVKIITRTEAVTEENRRDAAASDLQSIPLNPKYTFDTFIVGNSNRFPHAAALAVAESPAKAYNPLFIYGGVGLGKTHLMHAIGHYAREQRPDIRLMYTTSENFTNELISSIQQNKNMEFRNRYRNVDMLVVDDVQFLAGRDSTQEEFFNTFNTLYNAGKQIILTSDKPPKEIARLEERLCSRFEWGLIADIQRPDLETRIAILRKKALTDNIHVDDEVLELIAASVDNNIRELEGCLTRVVAFANLHHSPVTVDICEEALKEVKAQRVPRMVTPTLVVEAVSQYYNVSVEDITGTSRRREIAVPRQIAMFLIREMTGLSSTQIGQTFGRDHATVLYSCGIVGDTMRSSPDMCNQVDDLRKLVRDSRA